MTLWEPCKPRLWQEGYPTWLAHLRLSGMSLDSLWNFNLKKINEEILQDLFYPTQKWLDHWIYFTAQQMVISSFHTLKYPSRKWWCSFEQDQEDSRVKKLVFFGSSWQTYKTTGSNVHAKPRKMQTNELQQRKLVKPPNTIGVRGTVQASLSSPVLWGCNSNT